MKKKEFLVTPSMEILGIGKERLFVYSSLVNSAS
jgi:hypothetical protein